MDTHEEVCKGCKTLEVSPSKTDGTSSNGAGSHAPKKPTPKTTEHFVHHQAMRKTKKLHPF